MKDKLIGEIREVFISDKTYPEYVEALADHLSTKGYRPIQAGFNTENCTAKECPYRTRPMTNYEYIKTLSVRQMANFLKNDKCDLCNRCIYTCDSSGRDCEKGIMEWLKSESEE